MAKVRILALIVLIIGALAGFLDSGELLGFRDYWFIRPFRLGLDLQGGTHLIYKADVSRAGSALEVGEAMAGLRDVIERRVNFFGVSEPVVQTESTGGDKRLIVELAGVFDIDEAVKVIGETPYLEFRELERGVDGEILATSTAAISDFAATQLTGRYLKRASLSFEQTIGSPEISLEFNDEGAQLFEEITERNVERPVAIFLDGAPISIPVVREKISGGRAQITGRFTQTEAKQLVRRFNAGALPVPITLLSQQSIGLILSHRMWFNSTGLSVKKSNHSVGFFDCFS